MTNGALEGAYKIAGGTLENLSEQQILDCDSQENGGYGCSGGTVSAGFKYLNSNKAILESDYPYVSGTTGNITTCLYENMTPSNISVSTWNYI